MPDVVILILAASGTALATGIGAIPVFLLGERAVALTPFLLGGLAKSRSSSPEKWERSWWAQLVRDPV